MHCVQTLHIVQAVLAVYCVNAVQTLTQTLTQHNPNAIAKPKHKPLTLTKQALHAAHCVKAGSCVQAVHFQQAVHAVNHMQADYRVHAVRCVQAVHAVFYVQTVQFVQAVHCVHAVHILFYVQAVQCA